MKKRLNAEDQATLQALRDRLLCTIQFMENAQEFPTGAQLRVLIEGAAEKGDLRSLRVMTREVDQMTVALQPDQRDGLEALLQQKLGIDKEQERGALRIELAKVLRRGTVASEKERRRLEDYAEMLEATGGDQAEIDAVRRLVRSG